MANDKKREDDNKNAKKDFALIQKDGDYTAQIDIERMAEQRHQQNRASRKKGN